MKPFSFLFRIIDVEICDDFKLSGKTLTFPTVFFYFYYLFCFLFYNEPGKKHGICMQNAFN